MEKQEHFITHGLENFILNGFELKSDKNIFSQISTIIDIFLTLQGNIKTPLDIKYLLWGIDILFRQTSTDKYKGLYIFSKTFTNWLINKTKIDIKSVEGYIYTYNILDTSLQIIIKKPKKNKFITTSIREYYIGYTALNKLRYYIPTFVYTLGGFWKKYKDNNIPYILYEKIDGISLTKLTFKEWLIIFLQILLSLELAQKEYRFTHFDLHIGNVLIKTLDKPVDYTIYLDDKEYKIQNISLIPVIIDFGLSSIYSNGKSIGKTTMSMYGIVPYIIPRYDMYKFLCHSVKNLKHLEKDILPLFKFYKNNDPYNVIKLGINTAITEYCKMVTYSKAATYTPLLFFKWIYNKYPIIKNNFIQTPRKTYIPTYTLNSISYFKAKVPDDFPVSYSYISIKYILLLYNKYNYSIDINNKINILENYLYYSDELIQIDKKRLEKVFTLKFPENFNQICIDILENNIIPQNINELLNYNQDIKSFLEIYYTILQVKLEYIFKSWVNKFKKSNIFKLYTQNVDDINRVIRWYYSLSNK